MDDMQISDERMLEQLRPRKKKNRNKRSAFKLQWVKLPMRWIEALQRSTNASTYHLAHIILIEAFRREQIGGEIVLSTTTTVMSRNRRARAINELVKLGLIKVRRKDGRAVRVISIYY
jgi:hypothetical protein